MRVHLQSVSRAALSLTLVLGLSGLVEAAGPQSFHCSGTGVFGPTNIGTPRGGNFGAIIGDGSGVTSYEAAGSEFTIGGMPVGGTGFNAHVGEVLATTTEVYKRGQDVVHWPAFSTADHVLTSEEGDIHFQYVGRFELDLAAFAGGQPSFSGEALFVIVDGTGRFAGASGVVWVDVQVPLVLDALPPPGFSPALPFDYDFNGFIILKED
jgi:hypothetical protein